MINNNEKNINMNKNIPLVSVIVPVYNTSRYLDECIQSILSQSYTRLELILIDDGSTDNSLAICQRYESLDDRVVVISKKNSGVSSARNIGINSAKGEYILFVDSDDSICENMISIMLEKFEPEIELVMCGYNIYESSIEDYSCVRICSSGKIIFQLNDLIPVLEKNWGPWGKLYKNKLIGDVRFDEGISVAEDLKFNMDIIKLNNPVKVKVLENTLYNYRLNDSSVMRAPYSKKILDALIIEENAYNSLIEQGCSKEAINTILFNGIITFYYRFSKLSILERANCEDDYKLTRRIIRDYRQHLLKKGNHNNKEMLVMRIIIYMPKVYFLLRYLYQNVITKRKK